jgi:hypothetical protein
VCRTIKRDTTEPSIKISECSKFLNPSYRFHLWLVRHIQLGRNISVGFQSRGIGPRLDISDAGRTYPIHQTYPSPGRVPVPWQLGWIRHIQPQIGYILPAGHVRSSSSSRSVGTRSCRTYPTPIRYIRPFVGFQRARTPPKRIYMLF